MATERRIDRGDFYEVWVGEPTWEDPSVWSSYRVENKPGTEVFIAEANERTVLEDLTAALPILAALIGEGTDPAGTDSLQAIKNTTNATINASPAPYVKALADALITLARNQRKQIRAEMRAFDAAD